MNEIELQRTLSRRGYAQTYIRDQLRLLARLRFYVGKSCSWIQGGQSRGSLYRPPSRWSGEIIEVIPRHTGAHALIHKHGFRPKHYTTDRSDYAWRFLVKMSDTRFATPLIEGVAIGDAGIHVDVESSRRTPLLASAVPA